MKFKSHKIVSLLCAAALFASLATACKPKNAAAPSASAPIQPSESASDKVVQPTSEAVTQPAAPATLNGDAKQIADAAQANMAKLNSLHGEGTIVVSGQAPTDQKSNLTMDVLVKPSYLVRSTLSGDMFGANMSMNIYVTLEGNKVVSYNDIFGQWTKTATNLPDGMTAEDLISQGSIGTNNPFKMDTSAFQISNPSVQLGGEDCVELTNNDLKALTGVSGQDMKVDGVTKLYVGKRLGLIQRITSEIQTKSPDGKTVSTKTEMNYSDFNAVEPFTLPDEAKNAKSADELFGSNASTPPASANAQSGDGNSDTNP